MNINIQNNKSNLIIPYYIIYYKNFYTHAIILFLSLFVFYRIDKKPNKDKNKPHPIANAMLDTLGIGDLSPYMLLFNFSVFLKTHILENLKVITI